MIGITATEAPSEHDSDDDTANTGSSCASPVSTASSATTPVCCPFGHIGNPSEVTKCSFKEGYENAATDWAAISKGAHASLSTEGEMLLSAKNRTTIEKMLEHIKGIVLHAEDNMQNWLDALIAHITDGDDAPTGTVVHDSLAAMVKCGIGVLYDNKQEYVEAVFITPYGKPIVI